jgi:uncharacterized protein DUF4132
VLGNGKLKKSRSFGLRGSLTPLVPKKAAENNIPPGKDSASERVCSPLEVFSTSDTDLACYLNPEEEQIGVRDRRDRTFESRNPGISSLLARSSSERADLFVYVSKMLDAHEALKCEATETFNKLVPTSRKGRKLQQALLQQHYALEDLHRMTAHFEVIIEYSNGIENFAKIVFIAHERQPSATSIDLLKLLCGEQSQRQLLKGRQNRAEFLLIEKAHEALGNPPGSHPLSQMAAQEDERFKTELDRIVAHAEPALMPYARFLNDSRDYSPIERSNRQSDKDLLLEDLREQSPAEKGTAFLSAVELSRMASTCQIAKDGPQLGLQNVRHASLLKDFPGRMNSLALTLCKKKLVFTPDAALDLLRTCAVSKLDLGQGYKALPPQFWKSLGNSLPKNSPTVRQVLEFAVGIKEKHKQSLLVMAGLSSDETLRDGVSDKYRQALEEAQEALSSLFENFSRHATPAGSATGVLGRLFGSARREMTEEAWRPSWGVVTSLNRFAAVLPPAYYFDLDTSDGENLLAQAKDRNRGVLVQHNLRSDLETAEEAQALALSLDYSSPARIAALNLVVILPLEQTIFGFQHFTPAEREALRAFALSLHPLPKGGKPSAKWLDAVAESACDEILDKLLAAIGPVSSTEDDIIVAAVQATVRMPGVSSQTLEQIVNSGFEDAPQGKRHERLGNAALWVLSQRRGDAPVAAMRRIAETCRWIAGRDLAANYLKTMVTGDVDDPVLAGELLLPVLKIWPEPYREPFATGHAVFRYNAPDRLSLTWEDSDGKSSVNPTSEMKSSDASSVKRLKKLVPQLERTLGAHVRWIERLFLSSSPFRFDEWQERYLEHETRGALTQNLIWRAESADGSNFSFIPSQGGFMDASGSIVDPSDHLISLWHPVEEPGSVDAWRAHLTERSLIQPFAQAFRSAQDKVPFVDVVEALKTTRIEDKWRANFTALVDGYGWVSSKKIGDRQTSPLNLHLFEPISRIYVAVTLTRISQAAGTSRWFELSDVQLARADLGVTPTKAGLKNAKLLTPEDLTVVQHSEVVRSLYGLLSEAFMDPADTKSQLSWRNDPFSEIPFIRPMSEERARALQAVAPQLADPRAAKNWLGKADGEDRISVQDTGRLAINGVQERYVFCPFENRIWGKEDLSERYCRPSDSQLDAAAHVPFGLDTLLRRMTATIQLLTKDDRPGNGRISTR